MSVEAIIFTDENHNPIAAGHEVAKQSYVSTNLARFTLHKSIIVDYDTYHHLSDILKARVVMVIHRGIIMGLPNDVLKLGSAGLDYAGVLKAMIGIRHQSPVFLGGVEIASLVEDRVNVTHTVIVPGMPGVQLGHRIKGTQGNIYLKEDGCLDKVM